MSDNPLAVAMVASAYASQDRPVEARVLMETALALVEKEAVGSDTRDRHGPCSTAGCS